MAPPMKFGNPIPGRIGPFGHPDPVTRFVVTQPFKPGPPGRPPVHDGLDIDNGGLRGDPIIAIADGMVVPHIADAHRANIVRIQHDAHWSSGYAHLRDVLVALGDRVTRGDLIGSLGHTGFVTGPHLHFDISLDDIRQDPWPLLEQNQTGEEDFMPLPLRERYERWTVPAGTRFFTDGPGIGIEKQFTTEEKLQTVAESANGEWRLLRFQNSTAAPRELLYVRRAQLVPKVAGGEPAYDASVVAAIKAP